MTRLEILKKQTENAHEMRCIIDKAKDEKRALTQEEQDKFNALELEQRALQIESMMQQQPNVPIPNGRQYDAIKRSFVEKVLDAVNGAGSKKIEMRNIIAESGLRDSLVPVVPQPMLKAINESFLLSDLGVHVYSGTNGIPLFPIASSLKASIVGENEKATLSQLTFSNIKPSPKRFTTSVAVSNRALEMSGEDLFDFLHEELGNSIGYKFNEVVCSTEAVGDMRGPFVGLTDMKVVHKTKGKYTRDNLLELEYKVLKSIKALMGAKCSFIVNTDMAKLLEGILENANADRYLMQRVFEDGKRKGEILGHNAFLCDEVANDTILFGDFSHLRAPMFDAPTIIVDPYTMARENATLFTVNADYDLLALRPAFAVSALS